MADIFCIIFGYILGSLPFGYVIALLSGKKILEIGWKKTSGTNVYKNVGKWQGALTGILDALKGYAAVYVAQRLGLGIEIQALSGVAAVVGHNWSLFLMFSGGRGIGTLLGALGGLATSILWPTLLAFVLVALIWDAAAATLLFIFVLIFFYFYPPSFFSVFEAKAAGLLALYCLAPVLIKRLSPIIDLYRRPDRLIIFKNRILADNDTGNKPFKLFKILKPAVAVPAKMGVKAVKFPIDRGKKYFLKQERVVTEIRADDFKNMMIAASRKIVIHQDEINKINVFPVADKDTGYNLAATLLGVEGTISGKDYSGFAELSKDIKDAAMINARGNAGLIYTGYISEVLKRIKHLDFLDAFHLAYAMKKAIEPSRDSVVEPVDGTILDTIQAAGDTSYEFAKRKREKNIVKVLEEARKAAEAALKETPNRLKVLKDNNVVDAGALGFLKIIEAWVENLKGITPVLSVEEEIIQAKPGQLQELEYRYEVVAAFDKKDDSHVSRVKEEFSSLGNSLEVIESDDKIKFHIHTNKPEEVIERIKPLGADYRLEDMEQQVKAEDKKPLGLVIDAIADLPRGFVDKYEIEEVKFTTRLPSGKTAFSKEEIFEEMRKALAEGRPLPTTSAPSFKDFHLAYKKALRKFEKILVITATAKLSATYSSARIARSLFKKPEKLNINVFDSCSAEIGEGLIGIKAQELVSSGKKVEEVIEELKGLCPKVALLFCVGDMTYLAKGGRVKVPEILLKPISLLPKLGIMLIIGLRRSKVRLFGVKFGRSRAKVLAAKINEMSKGRQVVAAVAYADNEKEAKELKEELEKNPKTKVLFVSPISPVVGTHTGPDVLLAGFYTV